MKDKRFQYVRCYYCGRMTRLDKAIVLNISARLKPDVPEGQEPAFIITNPVKVYICPACARYRNISKKDIRDRMKEKDILKKLGIEI